MSKLVSRSLFAALLACSVSAGVAEAQQKPQRSQPTCDCICNSSGGLSTVSYDAIASCSAYEGKTCNFLASDNRLRTGSLVGCERGSRMVKAAASTSTAGVNGERPPKPKPNQAAPATTTKPAVER